MLWPTHLWPILRVHPRATPFWSWHKILHYSRQFSHKFCWRCGSNVTRFKHTALLHCVFLFKYPKWQCGLKNGDQHDGVANFQNPHCSRMTFGEPCFACYTRGYSVYNYRIWLVVSNMIFLFHNLWYNPFHWLSYVSTWLKPPTRYSVV